MWFILALISSVTFGLAGFMMKASSAQRGSTNHLLWGLYCTGTLGFLWWMVYTGAVSFSLKTILAGIVIGWGSAWGNLLFMKALETGPASLTSPLVNVNIVLTVAMSLLLYGEELSLYESAGVLLLIAAVSILPIDPNESLRIRNIRWYALVLMATVLFFLRNGGLKITEEWHLPNAAVLFVSYAFGLVWFTAEIFRKRSALDKPAVRTGLRWGLMSGIFSFAGMQVYAIALESGPASIVAPIFATNSLVVALLSILVFRERLSTVQILTLILLFVGLILIRIG
ncbi:MULTISPECIES: EamA family transporter [Thermoactinomyces]|jgi:uncharacterized membrane protein|uniref:DMT family transporter n=1 Tax=Thermoactinomyces daqus TaxID=1329516 RepID=A0A7W2AIP3_9BACL|nr:MULTISPECIES: EamA family transporter [Thermoactinomyces]MBA4544467.1 DMT family transporter [Thermoactinomyces daqus]MBH8599038.1 DMT family transporter [Thermoactinomyces sp. CICC 10523]MBH8605025.1 DMT family transporter [Thermoactinomyces sp. CICC 10522]MBH8608465.1 DMT family transporter [Thermoactinomyces sp. CICC 10521]